MLTLFAADSLFHCDLVQKPKAQHTMYRVEEKKVGKLLNVFFFDGAVLSTIHNMEVCLTVFVFDSRSLLLFYFPLCHTLLFVSTLLYLLISTCCTTFVSSLFPYCYLHLLFNASMTRAPCSCPCFTPLHLYMCTLSCFCAVVYVPRER